jgi:hypothetical protein
MTCYAPCGVTKRISIGSSSMLGTKTAQAIRTCDLLWSSGCIFQMAAKPPLSFFSHASAAANAVCWSLWVLPPAPLHRLDHVDGWLRFGGGQWVGV